MGLGAGFGYGGSTIDKTNYNSGNSRNDTANNSYSRSSSRNRSSRSSSSSRRSSRNYYRPSLNYDSAKKSILIDAPNKQITQSYQVAENPNPFMKDVLSMGQKHNTYQRQIANPEYDQYINKKNNEYNKKYNNFQWGNYNWNNLAQNNFENEGLINGIFGSPQNFNTVNENTNSQFGSFIPDFRENLMNNGFMSIAKQALFG